MISRPTARARRRAAFAEAGFTLAEMLVTVLLVALVLLAVLALFDMTSRTARTQTHLAEMQQSLRVAQQTVVRAVRMAGRGGLPTWDPSSAAPAGRLPAGIALAVDNNVPANTQIGGSASAPVLAGTDVITVRGVFQSPIYQVNPASAAFAFDPDPITGTPAGTLTLAPTTPTGAPQSLAAIADAIGRVNSPPESGSHPEALLLVSPLGAWAVVEMIPGGIVSGGGGNVTGVQIAFQARDGELSDEYGAISRGGAGFPVDLRTVAYAGLLEEYRFYVREARAIAGDPTSDLVPELVRARLYPNTAVPYQRDAASLTQVIADNVLDLQAAFGIDLDGDELITENLAEDEDPAADEWLFNASGDDPDPGLWNLAGGSPLYYLRINTLVRTDRAEPYYTSEALATIEDKDYTQAPYNAQNAHGELRYHRRQLRTTIDLRNL